MRAIALLAALCLVALAAPVSASAAIPAAGTDCVGFLCDVINRACQKLGGGQCVGESDAAARCAGEACDLVNAVCYKAFKVYCVG